MFILTELTYRMGRVKDIITKVDSLQASLSRLMATPSVVELTTPRLILAHLLGRTKHKLNQRLNQAMEISSTLTTFVCMTETFFNLHRSHWGHM
jgi:hypothetical protein